jgi:CDP-glucose 4,6-dehydratase
VSWRGRRVLVTGANGLVGSWLTRALLDEGASVVCLVRSLNPQSELFRSGTADRCSLVSGGVDDLGVVKRAIAHQRADTVFHLAAQSQVRVAYRDPFETFESNVRGTYTLLEACRLNRDLVERVVVASSDKAYGEADELPYTEDTPLRAVYPYDVSKAASETIARSYAATYGMQIAIGRCANIFGGGDLNWDRLIPGTIRSLLNAERPVIRSNGKLVRDYLYVRDAVHAYLTLGDACSRQDVTNHAFNFSMSDPLAVLDVVDRIQRAIGTELEPDIRAEHVAEIERQHLSSAKAHAVLGWSPRFALDVAMNETVEWYRDYLGRRG